MTSAGLDGSIGTEERKRQYAFPLLVVCMVGAALRILIGYHGGIWADEGFFLLVVNAPSWSGMMDFLRVHESHPPLFYAIMRVWRLMAGSSDGAGLMLPVAIGIAIVPAMYVSGTKLFSRRTGLIAAGLAAISPVLVEFSGQFRPYSLLPMLTLISCTALVIALDRGSFGAWCSYVVSTSMLVYTHHWSWLVVGGQVIAVASLLSGNSELRKSVWREVALAWIVIFLLYVPWIETLVFQIQNAGHPAINVENSAQAIGAAALAMLAAILMAIFGSLSNPGSALLIAGTLIAIAGVGLMTKDTYRSTSIAGRFLLVVPAVAIVAVAALSFRTNLLLARCIAMLSPLVLLMIARWLDQALGATPTRTPKSVALGVAAAISLISIIGVTALARSTRSNVREVASALSPIVEPSDLIIVVPEWYAASFSHYFKKPVEEIDYPHEGRAGMVDFSHVFERVADDAPVARLGSRIREARASGRRVWLITGRGYMQPMSSTDIAHAKQHRNSPSLSIHRAGQIYDSLRVVYGDPDTSSFVHGEKARYDEVLPFLFNPATAVRSDADSTKR